MKALRITFLFYEHTLLTNDAHSLMDWLPEFAQRPSEFQEMAGLNAVPFMRRAARRIYETGKFSNRGEFGELFLHIAVRQVFQSMPAIFPRSITRPQQTTL